MVSWVSSGISPSSAGSLSSAHCPARSADAMLQTGYFSAAYMPAPSPKAIAEPPGRLRKNQAAYIKHRVA